jgi:hypothetical protein
MIGLIAWAVALAIALVVGGILAYGLSGQRKRLNAAIAAARGELEPSLQVLRAAPPAGRHSATPAAKS